MKTHQSISERQAFARRACRGQDGRGGLLGRMAGTTGTGSAISQSPRTGGNPGSNRFRAMLAQHQSTK